MMDDRNLSVVLSELRHQTRLLKIINSHIRVMAWCVFLWFLASLPLGLFFMITFLSFATP